MKALTTPLAIVIAAALLALSGYMSARELAAVEPRFEMWPVGETGGAYRIDTRTGRMWICTPQSCQATRSVEERVADIQEKYAQ